jgi:hypothetical protein
MSRKSAFLSALVAAALLSGCKTAGNALESAGDTVADGAEGLADGAVSLVNVDLSNVLNDLALDLNIDRANIPINAQVPITIAANVCGVSINILSVSAGNQATCTATSTSPELSQVVQQQLSAGGDVGGGSQTSGDTTSGTQTEPPEEDPPQ